MQGKSSKAGVVLVIVLIMFLVTAVFLTFRDRRNREAFEPKDVHLRVYAFGPVSEENYFDEVLAAYQKSHDNVSIEHRVVPLPRQLTRPVSSSRVMNTYSLQIFLPRIRLMFSC